MVYTNNKRHSKNICFVVERPRTGLGLNSFKCFGPELWSGVPEIFKTYKGIS